MTQSNCTAFMMMYGKYISSENTYTLFQYAKEASDECMNTLFFIKIKKPVTTAILSIFFGQIGVDRFYLGDIGLGVTKLMLEIIASLCLIVGILGSVGALCFGIGSTIVYEIWYIVDIFITYKRAKELNYNELVYHIKRYRPEKSEKIL